MKLEEVLQLFVIVGGTVGITFQIAWAIFKEIHNNRNDRPNLQTVSGHSY